MISHILFIEFISFNKTITIFLIEFTILINKNYIYKIPYDEKL